LADTIRAFRGIIVDHAPWEKNLSFLLYIPPVHGAGGA
jgi:hypothetical protein